MLTHLAHGIVVRTTALPSDQVDTLFAAIKAPESAAASAPGDGEADEEGAEEEHRTLPSELQDVVSRAAAVLQSLEPRPFAGAACRWTVDGAGAPVAHGFGHLLIPFSECGKRFRSLPLLHAHVVSAHIAQGAAASECAWLRCQHACQSHSALAGHIVSHFPLATPSAPVGSTDARPEPDSIYSLSAYDPQVLSPEAYMAACVVYLIARYPESHEFIQDLIEPTLFEIAQRKLSPTARYSVEILAMFNGAV